MGDSLDLSSDGREKADAAVDVDEIGAAGDVDVEAALFVAAASGEADAPNVVGGLSHSRRKTELSRAELAMRIPEHWCFRVFLQS
jgi:hypothetical protein